MGPVTYLIAILGCADGSAACQQVALVPTRFESRATCVAAIGSALAGTTALDFPTVVAECCATRAVPASASRATPSHTRQLASRQG